MTPQEIIRLQAAQIKGNTSAIQAAEALEKAAQMLRQGAGQVAKKETFGDLRRERKVGLARFVTNAQASAKKDLETKLARNGWSVITNKAGFSTYANAQFPAFVLTVEGSSFFVKHGNETKISPLHTRDLDAFFEKQKQYLGAK